MTALRAVLLIGALALTGCSSIQTDDPKPTAIELTASRTTAATGQAIEFVFSATGSSITAVVIAYGDGAIDRVDAFGATSAGGRRSHAYTTPGTYTVTATIEDALTGNASDEVTVQVTSP